MDGILNQLGITPSTLIQMLYSEIRLTKKVPLSLSIPSRLPQFVEDMSKAQFDAELQKGMNDIEAGRTHSLEEMNAILKKDLKI